MSKDKTWKESLLKSSLPLETIVAEILTQLDLEIEGEFSYLRTNQEGIETEFSIDIVAQKLFDLTNRTKNLGVIDFLVECKYCSLVSNGYFPLCQNIWVIVDLFLLLIIYQL